VGDFTGHKACWGGASKVGGGRNNRGQLPRAASGGRHKHRARFAIRDVLGRRSVAHRVPLDPTTRARVPGVRLGRHSFSIYKRRRPLGTDFLRVPAWTPGGHGARFRHGKPTENVGPSNRLMVHGGPPKKKTTAVLTAAHAPDSFRSRSGGKEVLRGLTGCRARRGGTRFSLGFAQTPRASVSFAVAPFCTLYGRRTFFPGGGKVRNGGRFGPKLPKETGQARRTIPTPTCGLFRPEAKTPRWQTRGKLRDGGADDAGRSPCYVSGGIIEIADTWDDPSRPPARRRKKSPAAPPTELRADAPPGVRTVRRC